MSVVGLVRTVRPRPALRGRDAELTAVRAGLAAARSGRGSVVLVEGGPGTGKSRLLRETLRRAEQAGVRALAAAAVDGQQAVPFAPLLSAVLDGAWPVADPVALRTTAARADLRYWVAYDLRAALAQAAVPGPLAIVLDDLQWADPDTLRTLRTLTAGLRDCGILWVLATGGARPPVRADARLRLAPLTPGDVTAVVTDWTGLPPGAQLLALAGQAGGNPLILTELLRGLREEGRLRADGVVGSEPPRRLVDFVEQRLARLGPDTRRALLMAALLPCRFTATQLADVVRCRPSALVGPIAELLRAGLMVNEGEHLRFPCELLRRAGRASVPESLRTAVQHETAVDAGPWVPGWAGLTPGERKVAHLIASGATNRDAARELHLSPHTVGTHLRHIFEKLGINSRVELAISLHHRAA
ncbi:helix-turn-helix transcriptional regulator [Paractinoplanes maris]|uniref:helix-turn-helix transcriptional regulator n=1 Tax=Paractinoplanes maris TaxID=1734446 RepID=UPI002022159C|nr:LuxR family transcriptional regulator [Actinoplanes maris]